MNATVIHAQEEANCNTRKRKTTNDKRKELFERHNSIQEEAFYKLPNTISDLKTVLKDNNQYQGKLCESHQKTLSEIKNILKETLTRENKK